jgi:hypothetical protein
MEPNLSSTREDLTQRQNAQIATPLLAFWDNTGVELAFEPEAVDDFLFPKYVNSTYGFRNLGDKARA